MKLGPLLAAALAVLAVPAVASANGRFPAAGQIALDPADPNTLLVRATYGLLVTHDHGQRWSWICEGSVGYGNIEDPMMAYTADGTLIAGVFEGLAVSHDSGCQFDFLAGGLDKKYVIDLSTERADPSKGVLIISNSSGQNDAGMGTFLTQLWETSDNAKTWTQAGVSLPDLFLGLTVDAAPSDRNRVYLSGRYGPPDYAGALERSDDRGATWQDLPIPGTDSTHLPYIGGIDPTNPDVVYVRIDSDPSDQLVVTRDGGHTWSQVFSSVGNLSGFAVSPDGSTLALGGEKDGVWMATTNTLQFTRVSNVGVRCLTWSLSGLYACADEFVDKFTVGVSVDRGASWTPLMHLSNLCGPLACGAGSSTGKVCPPLWSTIKATINAQPCDSSAAGPLATGVTGAGGSTGAGGGSSGGHGCSCRGSAPGTEPLGMSLSLLAAAAFLVRRRR
jgi:MYXO-CTERM domain-containing protein